MLYPTFYAKPLYVYYYKNSKINISFIIFQVAAVNVLVIYKYSMKTQEMSKTKFIDFEDCIHIFHNFIPMEVTLVEDVIG